MNKIAQRKKEFRKKLQLLMKTNYLFSGEFRLEMKYKPVKGFWNWLKGIKQVQDGYLLTNDIVILRINPLHYEITGFKIWDFTEDDREKCKEAYLNGTLGRNQMLGFHVIGFK